MQHAQATVRIAELREERLNTLKPELPLARRSGEEGVEGLLIIRRGHGVQRAMKDGG